MQFTTLGATAAAVALPLQAEAAPAWVENVIQKWQELRRGSPDGNPLVNWVSPDIDIYTSRQELEPLQKKLASFQKEFTDEEAVFVGSCVNPDRFKLVVDNAVRTGFWSQSLIRSSYEVPQFVDEVLAYSGQPSQAVPLFETSYQIVTKVEHSDTYLDLIYHTTHHSLTDGSYQWTLKCEEGELYVKHRKVARPNPNTSPLITQILPAMDENVKDWTDFLRKNNAASTKSDVDNIVSIINDGFSPCDQDFNCKNWVVGFEAN